jgi:hypothetical protein
MAKLKQASTYSFLFLLFFRSAFADDVLQPLKTDSPPVIDGKLGDALWQQAPQISGFKTFVPDYGLDMADQTVVYYAYDRENLYFAYRCFDREPDKIKGSITRRDNIRSEDWICINLDSFNDQQALYGFYVNPFGIQEDTRFANGREDPGIDLIWYSAGQIDSAGYTLEIQIPFKSIRFANKEPVEMGVIFERRVSRRGEQGTTPPLKPERGMAFLTQMLPMHLYGIRHYKLLEVLPAVTHSRRSARQDGDPRLALRERQYEGSVTAKYGLTSDLIFDGTYNPDFSQVEADAGRVDVNLRFALFFPEKRPFFLEGNENFNFAGGNDGDPLSSVVHTRNIVDPIAGIKLSGKLGKKNFLSTINAFDELPADQGERAGQGKYAKFSILRYKRALSGDDYIGAIYTGRERDKSFNRVLGVDGQFRINESSFLGYHAFLSQTQDSALGLSAGDKEHALGLDYSYNTRNLVIGLGAQELSNHFNTETGFLTRTGITRVRASVTPKLYPPSKLIRRIDPNLYTAQIKDKPSGLFETENALSLRFILHGNSSVTFQYAYSTEVFLAKRFNVSGFTISGSRQFSKQVSFSTSYRYGNLIRFVSDPYQGRGSNASASLTYQPSENLNANVALTYADFYRDSDDVKDFDVTILRGRLTYQLNRFLFFRGIVENNTFRKRLLTDFLASFTYIPGTVIHFGYGSLYEKIKYENDKYVGSDNFLETRRGFFFKTSYLWRL